MNFNPIKPQYRDRQTFVASEIILRAYPLFQAFVRAQVLLSFKKRTSKLHVHLMPGNVPVEEVNCFTAHVTIIFNILCVSVLFLMLCLCTVIKHTKICTIIIIFFQNIYNNVEYLTIYTVFLPLKVQEHENSMYIRTTSICNLIPGGKYKADLKTTDTNYILQPKVK